MSIADRIFRNNVKASLAQNINPEATALQLLSGQGALFAMPEGKHMIATLIQGDTFEIIKINERSGDTLTIQRGLEGTIPSAFVSGSRLEVRLTAATLISIIEALYPPSSEGYWGSVSNIINDGATIDISADVSGGWGFKMSPDGTKMYVSDFSSIFQYSMSTPWDIANATLDASYSLAGTIYAFCLSTNGNYFFYFRSSGGNFNLIAYELSTPFDLGSMDYASMSDAITGEPTWNPSDLQINADGDTIMVCASNAQKLFTFSVATPFDMSTLNTSPASSLFHENINNQWFFSSDADFSRFLWLEFSDESAIRQFACSTPGDLTTASLIDSAVPPEPVSFGYNGMSVSGLYIFILGDGMIIYRLSW